MAVSIGLCVALLIISAGKYGRFDKDKSFYPVLLIVIASYYVLFAVMTQHAIAIELLIAVGFAFIAVFGLKKAPILIGIGLIVHGLYDILHVFTSRAHIAPSWWGEFCASVDIALGLWVIYLYWPSRHIQNKDA